MDFILTSLAIAAITITVGKTAIFKSLRNNVPGKWLRKLLLCPYCLSHWLSLFAVLSLFPYSNYLDLIVKTMAMVAVSAIAALPILLYLELLDENS